MPSDCYRIVSSNSYFTDFFHVVSSSPVFSSLLISPQRTGGVVFSLRLNTYPEAVNRPPTSDCAKIIPLSISSENTEG